MATRSKKHSGQAAAPAASPASAAASTLPRGLRVWQVIKVTRGEHAGRAGVILGVGTAALLVRLDADAERPTVECAIEAGEFEVL